MALSWLWCGLDSRRVGANTHTYKNGHNNNGTLSRGEGPQTPQGHLCTCDHALPARAASGNFTMLDELASRRPFWSPN